MDYPPFVEYPDERGYRDHFERCCCHHPLPTFDGILVRFRKDKFRHAFFERSVRRSGAKDAFSFERARRVDWIAATLADPNAELFVGWDGLHKRYAPDRRVAVVCANYVVVIALITDTRADFVTAFVADSQNSLDRIRSGPRWVRK